LSGGRQGYSHHPETKRWRQETAWLAQVHNLTAAEMKLRGYNHQSPISMAGGPPSSLDYVDSPLRQFVLLKEKQKHDEGARISIPEGFSEFWTSQQFSVMARGQGQYKSIVSRIDFFMDKCLGEAERMLEETLTVLWKLPLATDLADVLEILAEKVGVLVQGKSGELALAIYAEACRKGDLSMQAHTVFSDALAMELGGDFK